jgi:hypothetical protein
MKRINSLHPPVAAAVLMVTILGYSGCTTSDSEANAASLMRSTPSQHVSYQQPSKQPELRQTSNQGEQDPSLVRDIHPGWGPLNISW